ncbi:MAG: hypothetical protein Q4C75_04465 [Bergeyella zoohelcum]|nr:hypothetical protein [Bergeyella zoohelcum]
MDIIVLHKQSALDIAIQYTGKVENAFELALQNGKNLTDDLEAGESLSLTAYSLPQDKDILSYYQAKRLQPATAISQEQSAVSNLQGISYWTIGTNFIVK